MRQKTSENHLKWETGSKSRCFINNECLTDNDV